MRTYSRFSKLAVVVTLLLVTRSQAALDEVIWQATMSGSLGIQEFSSSIEPRLQRAGLGTKRFMTIVIGRAPDNSEKLALNVDMRGGATNIYLSVYNTVQRSSTLRLTASETTTMLTDGERISFTMDGLLRTAPNFGGGRVRLAGTGRMVQGVPTGLRANMTGILVDTRPTDLRGTTGLVLRATIRTNKLLRP